MAQRHDKGRHAAHAFMYYGQHVLLHILPHVQVLRDYEYFSAWKCKLRIACVPDPTASGPKIPKRGGLRVKQVRVFNLKFEV